MNLEDMVRMVRSHGFDHLADEMEYLWEHPDEFEQGGVTTARLDQYDEPTTGQVLLAAALDNYEPETKKREHISFMLGVCFGCEYNEEYPQDPDAEWRKEYDHDVPDQLQEDGA